MNCQRCGDHIPLKPPGTSGLQATKWCSENCRKRAWDDENARGQCTDCWATLSAPSARKGTLRCRSCQRSHDAARRQSRIERVAQMYRDGLTMRQIADALGYGPKSQPWEVTAARRQGLIGYRNNWPGSTSEANGRTSLVNAHIAPARLEPPGARHQETRS